MIDYGIGQLPFQDSKWSCGIAYIAIPSDVDRDLFISSCFGSGSVCLKTDDGTFFKNVPCEVSCFNNIIWPEKIEDYGSAVCYVTSELHQQPLIVGVFNKPNQTIDQVEHSWKIGRKFGSSTVEINGSPKEGYLNIVVDGKERSDFLIKIINKNTEGEFKLEVDGNIDIISTNKIQIESQQSIIKRVGVKENYTEVQQTESDVNFDTDRFSINSGEEQMVLGNVLKTLLDNILDEVSKSTVVTTLGTMPLVNASNIVALKIKTEGILSKYGFLR